VYHSSYAYVNRRGRWTTHLTHVSSIVGEGEQLTLHTCQPSWGITGKVNHSPCTQRTNRGRWTTHPMVAHSSKKYPKPPVAPRAQCPTQAGPSWEFLSTIPSLSRKAKNLTFLEGFVRMFVTYSSVLMCWSLISPRCTISRIKWYLISMCLE